MLPSDPGRWGFINVRSSGKCHQCWCFLLSCASIGTLSEMDTYREGRWWEGWDRLFLCLEVLTFSTLPVLAPSFCAKVFNIHSFIHSFIRNFSLLWYSQEWQICVTLLKLSTEYKSNPVKILNSSAMVFGLKSSVVILYCKLRSWMH